MGSGGDRLEGELTDAATDEGEEEGGIARDLGRNLELEESDAETEDDDVDADDDLVAGTRKGQHLPVGMFRLATAVVAAWEDRSDPGTFRAGDEARNGRNVQRQIEELNGAAKDHDGGGDEVDDAAARERGLASAWSVRSIAFPRTGGNGHPELTRCLRAPSLRFGLLVDYVDGRRCSGWWMG